MKRSVKTALIFFLLLLLLFAWAPWMDEQAIHDRILRERGWKDGTILAPDHFNLQNISNEGLEKLLEESRKQGVEDGILLCDYSVTWVPFGRWVASCEGGYFVAFYQ